MSELLLTGAILFGVYLLLMHLADVAKKNAAIPAKKPDCPPHRWIYRKQPDTEDEYMICDKCERMPLQD